MSETSEQFFCRHEDIDSQGFCRKCHVRAAIKLETAPTQQEQQAIDRALWSEIGLAIGRIEANLQKAEKSRETAANAQREVLGSVIRHSLTISERLETIETCQEKHRLALESITRILEKITGVAQPKRKRERKGKR